ncbi:MAG TPA: EAL domain-containing protein, partial [Candidatus Limnocylindria bacterium]|nr:EAL domain-containing protein [Candidatus Limnocylindria bacterium]
EPEFTELIRRALELEGFEITIERVAPLPDVKCALDCATWDIVLSDHSMPGVSSTDVLEVVQARAPHVPLILVSGHIGEEAAVEAMRAGAYDYVPKASLKRLGVAVRRSLNDASERATLRQREKDLETLHEVAFAAGRALDPTRLAEFAVQRARDLLSADGTWLHWRDDVHAELRLVAASQRDNLAIEPSLGERVAIAAFGRRDVVTVEDAISVPLFVGERTVGTLSAGSTSPRHFTPQEVRVLALLGAEVGPALEAGRLLAVAQRAANYDAITGLPNRASFLRKLGDQVQDSASKSTTFAVLYADLDRFREINDAFGHDGGDAVLRELGARIGRTGPETLERVARLGVDDFAFMLPVGSDERKAIRAAEDGIQFLREPFTLSEQPVHLSASIGIAVFPTHGSTAEELLRHAEAAMFAAKRTQTRYAVYGDAFDVNSQRKIALLRDLRRALETSQLTLHYQPQVDFRTGRLVGAEALLRWAHPERGMIPPLEFIPIAEETGLIHQLTPWVLKHALVQQRIWWRSGLELRMSVNVSMRNLRDPEFLAVVDAIVNTAGVDSGSVTLEVTEAAMMLEATRTLDVLRRIRALGVNISIDDFGTGYSSLAYLSRLPVNEVKIDRAFVMDLTTPGPRAIVEAVINLGKVFGLRVIAEGVKDAPTWTHLHALGCEIAQGYYVSEPITAAAFATWATQSQSRRSP